MNLNVLRYVLEVEKSRSITGAARQLFISQPNLSRDIRELEEEIGFSIFTRSSRGVVPTERGREFLLLARKAVRQYQALEDYCAKEESDSLTLLVCVPSCPSIASAFTSFLVKYGRRRRLSVKYHETEALEAIEQTLLRDCSFSIIRCPDRYEKSLLPLLKQRGLSAEVLGRYDLTVLLSERHPLAGTPLLTAEMLETHTQILCEDTSLAAWLHEDPETRSLSTAAGLKQAHAQRPGHAAGTGTGPDPEQSGGAIHIHVPGIQYDLLSRLPGTFQLSPPVPEPVLDRFHLVSRKFQGAPHRMTDLIISPADYRFTQLENAFLEMVRDACFTGH